MQINANHKDEFIYRHNSSMKHDTEAMLKTIGVATVDQLIDETIPAHIRLKHRMQLPEPMTEVELLAMLSEVASKNKIYKNFIGQGYYGTNTPLVVLRNIFENPGWYTAYTPYQAEIAQGRLEALLNFQTMIIDLTGMEIANASLLDEGTAAAEAMHMLHSEAKNAKATKFFVSELCFPQTIDVLKTRTEPIGVELVVGDHNTILLDDTFFGALIQYPARNGEVIDYSEFMAKAIQNNVLVAVAADLLSLTLLTPPGEWGADAVVGSAQRFGVPMGYGGPHAGFFATKDAYKRQMPGRLIGVSIDSQGNSALRMALQTREQHIKREKATSNICTAQVLLSIMASMYGVHHGPEGLKGIAGRIHGLTKALADALTSAGLEVVTKNYFDTITVKVTDAQAFQANCEKAEININKVDAATIRISIDETHTPVDIQKLVEVLTGTVINYQPSTVNVTWPSSLLRKSTFMTHPVFNSYHSEHEMLRYIKSLEAKDLSLCHSMIALGSCTMKLNATAEMIPVTMPGFGQLHPFIPRNQALGYTQIFNELSDYLQQVTGFAGMSLQPNSGASGEYAGLMVIREYLKSIGQGHRNIALIPSSAHGTNPASAAMAGMKVVVTKTLENGYVDIDDLKAKAEEHKDNLACLMVTYPSTYGVFEENIIDICAMIHQNGGQVYMDGANMNAQVGLTSPANIGADVCHLNLHKTFCIPHGGGGPGMGPIGVAKHLVPFLPGHSVVDMQGGDKSMSAVSAAPWGSASILLISYAYIRMMGTEGLEQATKYAILNANYIKARLEKHYQILYVGSKGRCAHEMILDTRVFKGATGVEAEDIAKRLMDYGFHAPTMSFPVAGTIMIEPTESEPKAELDRFCDAMIGIKNEVDAIANGTVDKVDNVLKNAPHTASMVIADEWNHGYSRQEAAFPLPYVRANKFWPTVGRVNNTHGDRNLVCSCLPIEAYEESAAN
ncbi:glycine dehydrogenase [Bacteroidetes bacterium UKL13-3]|jgi:glycine dehydrogenase|nr:glycine dehydrogenase [Bacteroidetes bacterium UKL13-3]HCP94162.1 glycine dehydrogenase (aminomethyl-transferring) [Bacteroidota bacterium]